MLDQLEVRILDSWKFEKLIAATERGIALYAPIELATGGGSRSSAISTDANLI
jgi:hypothetical protein